MSEIDVDFRAVALKQASDNAELNFKNIQLTVLVDSLQRRIEELEPQPESNEFDGIGTNNSSGSTTP